jgi:hypothetical protein
MVVVCSVTTFSSGLNTRLAGEGFSSLATVFVAVDLELLVGHDTNDQSTVLKIFFHKMVRLVLIVILKTNVLFLK